MKKKSSIADRYLNQWMKYDAMMDSNYTENILRINLMKQNNKEKILQEIPRNQLSSEEGVAKTNETDLGKSLINIQKNIFFQACWIAVIYLGWNYLLTDIFQGINKINYLQACGLQLFILLMLINFGFIRLSK